MLLDDYQDQVSKFRGKKATPEEYIMGLLEEAGEVAAIFKRLLRGDFTPDIAASKLHKELGDIMWYISQIALDNDWKLSSVAEGNLEKLESRKLRNKIIGTGDDR